MKRTGTGRVLSVLFLGLMYGGYRHFDQMRWLARGRDAFLAEQGHRFDKIIEYHTVPTMLIAGVILAAITFGLYEVIAAGITRVLPPSTVEE
jgi:hypothetical protein